MSLSYLTIHRSISQQELTRLFITPHTALFLVVDTPPAQRVILPISGSARMYQHH
jgi:hypothetical protein